MPKNDFTRKMIDFDTTFWKSKNTPNTKNNKNWQFSYWELNGEKEREKYVIASEKLAIGVKRIARLAM